MITDDQIAHIEERILKKAEMVAYQLSDPCGDRNLQLKMYEAVKSYIIYGARLFQEELSKLTDNET